MDKAIIELSNRLGQLLLENKLMIATAESCTGGGIAQAITEISGSSAWFDRGFVTYSNQAKIQMLDVNPETLEKYGAVSEQVAIEMAQGAINNSHADIAATVTGIAGPTGGSDEKPVGLVYIGWKVKGFIEGCQLHRFTGDRSMIRQQTIYFALEEMIKLTDKWLK